jgi:glutamate-1-semialdehyde 2,1-aminomutase
LRADASGTLVATQVKSRDEKTSMSTRYNNSETLLKRAVRTIPLGSQTFSKSRTQYPFGVSPYFITRAKGAHVWDADGNEFIDFVNSLGAVMLGYADPDVDAAVKVQMEAGVIFSLPHPIEMHVAEKIVEMVPCAEMVRFGKNGSDATAGAIRLARAYTGRDRVAVCGYHGWQDWYIGSTARHRGVPRAVRELTHTFAYNDLPALSAVLKRYRGEFAAVILEPVNSTLPASGYLEGVKEIAHQEGALLLFDETITGFRCANGGAQEYFGVVPDIATFGKGLANGFPLSAIAGRADIMRMLEEVFFSFTFGGETLSLAAALATTGKLQRDPVVEKLHRLGGRIISGLNGLIEKYRAHDLLGVSGLAVWSFVHIKDTPTYSSWQLRTLFLQEMFARNVLTIGTHNLSYSHSDADIDALLSAYDEVIPILQQANNGKLHTLLCCEPLEPLFKVR